MIALALTLALFTATRLPSEADDVAALTDRIGASTAKLTSFVIHSHITGTTGVETTITFVRPANARFTTTVGQLSMDFYLVDGMLYRRGIGGGWQKAKVDPSGASLGVLDTGEWLKSSEVRSLPDRQEDGVSVGAFEIKTHHQGAGWLASSGSQSYVCTYDKSTNLLRICSSETVSMVFTKFNDPANSVVLPPEANEATLIVLPSPAAAPSVVSPEPAVTASPP